ncbi:hypothetical protein pv_7 [Pithovirus sibericum]|uniref:Uncharacterized protein n=1 Tax=Pithovirus sibericum TaxID=1450746 RepID=W5S4H1_9VIRU|nr:hypothetical protein pv_7 [Pithovirus sibericum]AHH01574.1 hypothetical protein pv_7 [Pithovirus sibericum]
MLNFIEEAKVSSINLNTYNISEPGEARMLYRELGTGEPTTTCDAPVGQPPFLTKGQPSTVPGATYEPPVVGTTTRVVGEDEKTL